MAVVDLTFLGTGSAYPTPARGVSSTIFRYDGECWMFDCGECTQTQLMKSIIKAGKITKFFITHLHGDHVFGLPGLLCTLSQTAEQKTEPVEIYGPEGLAIYLRVALGYSASDIGYKFIINELVPTASMFCDCTNSWALTSPASCGLHPAEIPGRKIHADDGGVWHLLQVGPLTVKAGPLRHRVPTFGFIIEEANIPGRLDAERARCMGIPQGPLLGRLKKGESVRASDGSMVTPADVLEPDRPGRKVVLLGDTRDAGGMLELSSGADVVVHETTFENAMKERALERGHSTPEMAGAFAAAAGAKRLIITHFSQRYKQQPDSSVSEGGILIQDLLAEAKAAFGSDNVVAAEDMLTVAISLA